MSNTPFVHLRVHTAYSLSAGAIKIPDLIKWAQQHAMPAIAMTDTNNMFGALDFSLALRGAGVQPIIGAEIGLRRTDGQLSNGQHHLDPDPIVLLVQNETGHLNLMDLLSRSYLTIESHESPQVSLSDLSDCSEGLICLTGGANGVIGRLCADGQMDFAKSKTKDLKDIFADRLYMEIGRHGADNESKSESPMIDLAYEFDIPLVATNNCYYVDKDMAEAHDALMCIASAELMEQDGRDKLTPEYYLKSAHEMTQLFSDLPEAIANTVVVAQRCHYITQTIDPLLPEYPYLEGRTEAQALRDLSEAGLEKRLVDNVYTDDMDDLRRAEVKKQYFDRMDFELKTIVDMGFPGYFLIVADFIQWGKDKNIPIGPGRGSGAGSVVAWALTITDLDPLRWGLLFERFLNPERVSMPDFDIDFCQERREEVIKYVQEQYGRDKVAQIITFGKLQARAVVRDVGRVLAMPYSQVDRIGKLIPSNPANPITLAQALDTETLLQKERDDDPSAQKMLGIALKLEGLYRHASTHAAGVVIGDRPLHHLVPLYRDPKSDMPVTQFNLKFVEKAGLVKFDFLGLATLTIMDKARQMIENRPEVEAGSIDFSLLPLDDKATYDMIARAETGGVFQLESSGMKQVIKGMKPDRFEDLIALVSLYRPGPMENIPTYNACKHGEQEPKYLHPVLKPVLEETFGIPVYQEQVMQMAQVLAGYTLGGADLLRRAMGKKIPEEMVTQRQMFCDGAKEHHNVDTELANEIFNYIEAFAGYGFNKSHAAAYALIAYHTAWLKAHYPVEFMASTMILAMHNTDKLSVYKDELDRMDVPLLLPNVNYSDVLFTPETDANGVECVRYALGAVKGVGEDAMRYVVDARNEGGVFKDIFDFVERVDAKALNKRIMENLTKAGAFDDLCTNRRQIFENIESILRYGQSVQSERNSDQVSLFGEDVSTNNRPKLTDVHDWQDNQRLTMELTAIGFYLSAHPLENYQNICDRLDIKKWADVEAGRARLSHNKPLRVAGIVTDMRVITTKRGNKICFLSLSDTSGPFEITLFEDLLNQNWDLLKSSQPIVANIKVEKIRNKKEDGSLDTDGEHKLRVTATYLSGLEDEAAQTAKGLRISLTDDKPMPDIANAFTTHAQDFDRGGLVKIILHSPNGEIELSLPNRQRFTSDLLIALKNIPGIMKLEEL